MRLTLGGRGRLEIVYAHPLDKAQSFDAARPGNRVLVTLFPKANRTVVVSFRSQNGEALPVASRLQGGGHANAAGTTLPKSVTDPETAIAYLRQALNPRLESGSGFNTPFAGLRL